ncbi:MAG TPA: hypothetical protein VIG56_06805, partial [Pseudolabrys sp.]
PLAFHFVIAGLDPAIHDDVQQSQPYVRLSNAEIRSWMPGSSPGMTPRALHAREKIHAQDP